MENQDNQSTSFSTIEVLLKDIYKHIPIILIKEDAFTINCFVLFAVTTPTWTFGHQKLEIVVWKYTRRKNEHEFDVAICHDKRVVGNAPKNLNKPFYQFLSLPSCSISCEVTVKRVSRGGWISLRNPCQI